MLRDEPLRACCAGAGRAPPPGSGRGIPLPQYDRHVREAAGEGGWEPAVALSARALQVRAQNGRRRVDLHAQPPRDTRCIPALAALLGQDEHPARAHFERFAPRVCALGVHRLLPRGDALQHLRVWRCLRAVARRRRAGLGRAGRGRSRACADRGRAGRRAHQPEARGRGVRARRAEQHHLARVHAAQGRREHAQPRDQNSPAQALHRVLQWRQGLHRGPPNIPRAGAHLRGARSAQAVRVRRAERRLLGSAARSRPGIERAR
mmetsp:Transcript_14467/g.36637  ORF Transcript_14467/g.36637 Transcript_14467/m.36637 type:complete len:263 (+) Transcript_14467:333-1121(+)